MIVYQEFFRDHAQALEALGLAEQARSQENVDAMREGIERFNRGGEDDAVLDDLYDADAAFHSRADEPDTGVYRGREAIRGMMRMWRDTFEDFQFRVDEYIDAGDTLILPGWVTVRARGSSAEVRQQYTWLVEMRDGRVLDVREYHTKEEALKAVGLAE
jgi:ketosteroid isomerase-like protein